MRCSRHLGLAVILFSASLLPTTLLARPVAAQPTRPAVPGPVPAATGAAVSAIPQQTTATYGDWVVRCTRINPTTKVCEMVQGINSGDRIVAQFALGRVAKGQPMHLTILVPSNVTLATAPTLATPRGEQPGMSFVWRRCLPGGCMADAVLDDETLRQMRGWTEPAKVVFADGAGQEATLPFSPKGLPQALDALAKEEAG